MTLAVILTRDSIQRAVCMDTYVHTVLTGFIIIVRSRTSCFLVCGRTNSIQKGFTCNLKHPVADESVKGKRETSRDPADLRFYRGSYLRTAFAARSDSENDV